MPAPALDQVFAPGLVTGVGSLPGGDPAAALELVARWCPELPFWPQLPARADMLAEVEQGPALAGWSAFLEAARAGRFAQAHALKGQLVGPVTLLAARGLAPGDPAAAPLISRLEGWALAQARALAAHGPALIVLDEPALGARPEALALLRPLLSALRSAGVAVGVHTCAPPAWALLRALAPDLVSFDAARDLEAAAGDPDCRALLEAGAWLAAGIVPTDGSAGALRAGDLFRRLWLAWRRLGDPARLAARTLISASCGLGLRPPAEVPVSFGLARAVGQWVQRAAR